MPRRFTRLPGWSFAEHSQQLRSAMADTYGLGCWPACNRCRSVRSSKPAPTISMTANASSEKGKSRLQSNSSCHGKLWLGIPNDSNADPYPGILGKTAFNRELLRRMKAIPAVRRCGRVKKSKRCSSFRARRSLNTAHQKFLMAHFQQRSEVDLSKRFH